MGDLASPWTGNDPFRPGTSQSAVRMLRAPPARICGWQQEQPVVDLHQSSNEARDPTARCQRIRDLIRQQAYNLVRTSKEHSRQLLPSCCYTIHSKRPFYQLSPTPPNFGKLLEMAELTTLGRLDFLVVL